MQGIVNGSDRWRGMALAYAQKLAPAYPNLRRLSQVQHDTRHVRTAQFNQLTRLIGDHDSGCSEINITQEILEPIDFGNFRLKDLLRLLSMYNSRETGRLIVTIPIGGENQTFSLDPGYECDVSIIRTNRANYDGRVVSDTYSGIADALLVSESTNGAVTDQRRLASALHTALNERLVDQTPFVGSSKQIHAMVKLLAITQISEHKRIPGFGKVVEAALKLAKDRGFLEPILGLLSFSDRGGANHTRRWINHTMGNASMDDSFELKRMLDRLVGAQVN